RTAPYLHGDELFQLVELCMAGTGDGATLKWATPDVRAFYHRELTRRQAIADEAERAQAERRADEERQRFAVRDMQTCAADCKQRGYECLTYCRSDAQCREDCRGANRACVDGCESRAYQTLGR